MKITSFLFSVLLTTLACAEGEPNDSTLAAAGLVKDPATGLITRVPNAEPTQAQKNQMENMRYGMFIHFGINTFMDQEWTDGSVPVTQYAPKEIAADEWVLAAKNAGMSHVVLVCKHHEGFCLWPTKLDEMKYSVAHAPNKTDVVKAVAEACNKHDVRFAVYYSMWDRRWDAKNADLYKKDRAAADKAYVDYMVGQLDELLSNYGPVTELWFDGSWAKKAEAWDVPRVYDAIKRRQPLCQVAVNWSIGHPDDINRQVYPKDQKEGYPIHYFPSDFRLGDPQLPIVPDPKVFIHHGEKFYMPFESTVCMNNRWFWHSGDTGLKSVGSLVKLYNIATAQDNLLLLNSPPGPDGHMRPATIQRMAELRERLGLKIGGPFPKRVPLEVPVAAAKVEASSVWDEQHGPQMAVDADSNSRWASKENVCEITQTFSKPTRIGQVILDEYEENGQYRIQEFVLEAQVKGAWRTLVQGGDIGADKRFEFAAVEASALRLRILKASLAPSIYQFSALAEKRQ